MNFSKLFKVVTFSPKVMKIRQINMKLNLITIQAEFINSQRNTEITTAFTKVAAGGNNKSTLP